MRRHQILVYCGGISAILLTGFFGLQHFAAEILKLPAKWIVLALFPTAVGLIAGGYVVKLKAGPNGLELEADASLREAPAAIQRGNIVAATQEGVGGLPTPADVRAMLLEKQYPDGIVENLYLVHEAMVICQPSRDRTGLYRVRVRLEGYSPKVVDEVMRVSYRLYSNEFPNPVVSTEARHNDFELWLNVYGEFTVVAFAERKNDLPPIWLTRYLNLPGRPTA